MSSEPSNNKKPRPPGEGNGLALLIVIATILIGFMTSVLANAAFRTINYFDNANADLIGYTTFVMVTVLGIAILIIGKLALAVWRDEDVPFWRLMVRRWRRDLLIMLIILVIATVLGTVFALPTLVERGTLA